MSEKNGSKFIVCHICKCSFSIAKEGLPADLFNLIIKYNNEQLIWLCKTCKLRADTAFYFLTVAEKQRNLEQELSELKDNVRLCIASVNNLNDRNNCVNNSHLPQNLVVPTQPHTSTHLCQNYASLPEIPRVTSSATYEPVKGSLSTHITIETIHEHEISPKLTHNISCLSTDDSTGGSDTNDNSSDSGFCRELSTLSSNKNNSGASARSVGRVDSKIVLSIIKDIFKEKIKINEEELKNNRKIVLNFLDELLLPLLKQNVDFNCLFEKYYQTGSSFEGLRITSATEYDINIVLKFPGEKVWLNS